MQQLAFLGPGRVEWQEVREPTLEAPTDSLVRPVAVTLCDADLLMLRGELPASGPFAFGHEFAGEIVGLGERVTGFSVGQIVLLPVEISCGACERCRRGLTGFCRAVRNPAAWGLGPFGGNWPGAFSDLLRIPFAQHMMVPLPHGIELRAAVSAGDNLSDAWRTVAPHLRENPGAKVLVVGRASIGLFAVAIARALGASVVDYLDTDPARLSLAGSLGANPIEGPPRDPVGSYPITVDASFDPAGLVCALRSIAAAGVCTSVPVYFQDTPLPLFDMWRRGVRFQTGPANCRARMSDLLDLVQAGRIHPERVTTGVVAWKDLAEALADPPMKPLILRDAAQPL